MIGDSPIGGIILPVYYKPSLTSDDVIDALAKFIAPFCSGSTIVRTQGNRTPFPGSPCIVLREVLQVDLSTPVCRTFYDYLSQITTPTRIDIQVDFYGSSAGEQCKAIKSVLRTEYATNKFPHGIKPLYASDGMQMPFATGEEQYEMRWVLTISLQYNASLIVPQDSASFLSVNRIIPVWS